MAWVTEYDMTWRSRQGSGATGSVYLQRDGGSYQMGLTLRENSLKITNSLPSLEDPIVRTNCTFTVINDLSDFYELLPLMTISNGQIRVVVTLYQPYPLSSIDIFVGYLNCEAINQNMLNKSDLNFTASGLLNKLQYDHPVSADILQTISLIDLIDDCLTMTGSSYPIYVHCSLEELNNALGAEETLFNKTALFTEILWENNIDRMSALDILKMILKSFDCFLYWYQDYWWIEHYPDMGIIDGSYHKTYVQYDTGTSAGYQYADAGSDVVVSLDATRDIHDKVNRPQVGDTQVLSITPGMKYVEIRLDQKQYFNIINSDLTDITYNTDIFPLPAWRQWIAYDDANVDWGYAGARFFDIANSIYRTGWSTVAVNGYGNGLTTMFKLTLKSDTQLTLKWKYSAVSETIIPGSSALEDYTITFTYWIAVIVGASTYFLFYNESAGTWTYNVATVATALQTIEVSGSELDPSTFSCEVSLTIPIGDTLVNTTDPPDVNVYFGIGTEEFDDGIITPQPSAYAAYGDISATISETADNNLIKGSVNTAFLNELIVDLELFDSGWSYRNVLLTGSNFHLRATEWGYASSSDSLARRLLASKFRYYNVARQKITLDYITDELLHPLQLWLDNKQSDKKFILTGDAFLPEADRHSVELTEYDDETEINLI